MECQRCGACCCFMGVILVGEEDDVPSEFVEFCELGFYRMKTKGSVCVCYREDLHEHCSIYPVRPKVCRLLVPGGVLCRMVRQIKAKVIL